jgi:hypothetical protein
LKYVSEVRNCMITSPTFSEKGPNPLYRTKHNLWETPVLRPYQPISSDCGATLMGSAFIEDKQIR